MANLFRLCASYLLLQYVGLPKDLDLWQVVAASGETLQERQLSG